MRTLWIEIPHMHNKVPLWLPCCFISVVEDKHYFQLLIQKKKKIAKREKLFFCCLPELLFFQVADYILLFPVVHINLIINEITVLMFFCAYMVASIFLSVVCSILRSLAH